MRRIWCALVVGLALPTLVHAYGIGWFVNNNWLNYSDGVTHLDGDTSSNIGCFVQLLWVGPNGVIDPAVAGAPGLYGTELGDDVVVDWRWVGAGAAGGDDGWFSGGEAYEGGDIVSGRYYFARVWSAPASDYGNGYVPICLTNKYGNSSLWQYPRSNPVLDDFDITYDGDINTTLSPLAIPEPQVVLLLGVGAAVVRTRMRRRNL